MNIVNHTTGEKCELKFHSYSYFTRERQRKVRIIVYTNNIVKNKMSKKLLNNYQEKHTVQPEILTRICLPIRLQIVFRIFTLAISVLYSRVQYSHTPNLTVLILAV